MLYSEAQSSYEMELVGSSVRARMASPKYPDDAWAVVTQDWQYSGLHQDAQNVRALDLADYNNTDLPTPRLNKWRRAVRVAHHILTLPDSLLPLESTHYYSPQAMTPAGTVPPWARGQQPDYVLPNRFRFYTPS
jgi:hypothetical protein